MSAVVFAALVGVAGAAPAGPSFHGKPVAVDAACTFAPMGPGIGAVRCEGIELIVGGKKGSDAGRVVEGFLATVRKGASQTLGLTETQGTCKMDGVATTCHELILAGHENSVRVVVGGFVAEGRVNFASCRYGPSSAPVPAPCDAIFTDWAYTE